MTTKTDTELLTTAGEEVQRIALARLELLLDPSTVMTLVGLVQLALRHPQNAGAAAAGGREFVDGVREWFEFLECPALVELVCRGESPSHDVEPGELSADMARLAPIDARD